MSSVAGCRYLLTLLTTLLLLAINPQRVEAAMCAATPAGAVLQSLGMATATAEPGGFRVRSVAPDATLRRAFVQVERCDHPEYPAVNLPLGSLPTAAPATAPPAAMPSVTEPAVGPDLPRGSAVAVSSSDPRIRLQLRGRLLQAATVGREVEVEVAALSADGESRHLRGKLVAADRVEVQP